MWSSHKSNTSQNVPINLTSDLTHDQLHSFKPFSSWLYTLERSLDLQHTSQKHPFHQEPYKLRSIDIQAVDFFGGGRIGFLKLTANIKNDAGASLPGIVFLRGGSVAILLVLEVEGKPGDEPWVVLTVQPRIPAGQLEMVELPAGMIDDSGNFAGAAAMEIQEECGIDIPKDRLTDLTELALEKFAVGCAEDVQAAVYPSPGGSDEFIKIFAYKHIVKPEKLHEWQGKLTGLRDEGEKITLKIVKLKDLWKESTDAKALSAIALYDGLKREGKI
ncbi:hypothetical protein EDC01DRAFT_615314 [Geopyxis carbonaria]|nr:hypothetical protein EDC01DRAFT_615314 [Geopyxis carbonaria]